MSQAGQIFKNTSVLAAARLIERGANLIIAFLMSRRIGAAGLGLYATAIAYYQVIALAGEMGSTSLLIREIAKDRSQTNSYIVHASVLAGGLSLAATGVAWAVIPQLGHSGEMQMCLMVIVLAVLPGTLNTIQEAAFVAHQKVELQTFTTLLASVLLVVVSAVLLAQGHGVVSLLVAFVLIQMLVTLVYYQLINRRICRLRWDFDWVRARAFVREIRAFAGSSLIAGFCARPEVIILSLLASPAQVGYYTAALKIVDLWQFLPQTFMVNVFPVLSRSYHLNDGRAEEIQHRSTTYLLAVALPIAVGLGVTAEPIITTLFGDGFEPAVVVLRVLSATVVLFCLIGVLWRVLAARGEQALVLKVQIVSLVVRLVAGTLLIAGFAANGAAVANLVGLALFTLLLAVAVRQGGTRLHIIAPSWRFAAAAMAMGVCVASLAEAGVGLWALAAAGAVLYLAGVVVLRALSPDDTAFLGRLVSGVRARSRVNA
jgi:O-antigen/teichoic acid export membrane protein